ncbi:MAG: aspartate dehydrogenase [Hylemonella sp.]|nr:aspartate dehydrogenase [Hylemonella sp.]
MTSFPTASASPAARIAILGLGAIGRKLLAGIQSSILPGARVAALVRAGSAVATEAVPGVDIFTDTDALLQWQPDLVIECAGHEVVSAVVPHMLQAGVDVILVSLGALGDASLRESLAAAARAGRARLINVSGAIGGLDALAAASGAGITSVRYTGRKPPQAWRGTPAEQVCDLDAIRDATLLFEGSAADSARLYPKNANVTAAVALAGVGFEKTAVRMLADPTVTNNVHELEVEGDFGRLALRLENSALPDNPRTSWLAALSIEAELRKYLALPRR